MAARNAVPIDAMNIEGCLRIPDLSTFVGTTKDRVKCTVCGTSGPADEIWVLACLAGHPFTCPVEGCDAKPQISNNRILRHMHAKHPELMVTEETKEERLARLKRARREVLAEAGIAA